MPALYKSDAKHLGHIRWSDALLGIVCFQYPICVGACRRRAGVMLPCLLLHRLDDITRSIALLCLGCELITLRRLYSEQRREIDFFFILALGYWLKITKGGLGVCFCLNILSHSTEKTINKKRYF